MSKTKKTRPYHVRLADRRDLNAVEEHNHVNGRECDLPPFTPEGMHMAHTVFYDVDENNERGDRKCSWVFVYRGVRICACPTCSWTKERRLSQRITRRKERKQLSDALRDVRNGRAEDSDVVNDMVLPQAKEISHY